RRGPDEPRDRRPARRRGEDREEPHHLAPGQDGPRAADPGRRLGGRTPRRRLAKEGPVTKRLREAVAGLMPRALDELRALVALRSVADAAVEDPRELAAAARWVAGALTAEGLEARVATTPDGTDAVIATHDGPPGSPRVLLYAHYDVQPAHAA